ncbi:MULTISPECIES: hypothetical protein [Pseudanabaena]|uniref:hypothetical protein n=1 Tax=Pseudanabaena TaxID=1152 RepID=UPI00247A6395|nr:MULTISPECIES: hypothetical protein [Pseudanabaena]MEA5489446.1 hypothetical protein [Pseudanabaena sp. CCNP1317]WGS73335.1 hypothetical protein OA858_04700 [Pseudanabaena galeata CCNP1313]
MGFINYKRALSLVKPIFPFVYCLNVAILVYALVDSHGLSAQAGNCDYSTGTAVGGQNISVDLCSISRISSRKVNFDYNLGNERIQAQANCQSRTWLTFPEQAVNRPQSQATRDMMQIVCTAPSFNEGIAIGVVFDPPSNVRSSPNGSIVCTIRELTAIELSGGVVGDGWLRTNFCGRGGVIHRSQVLYRR